MSARETIVLTSPAGELEADVVPSLAMVCTSLRHRGEELLHQRNGLDAYAERGSTMGVPLLHPWANRLDRAIDSPLVPRDPNGTPIHGVVPSALPFAVDHRAAAELRATFDTDVAPAVLDVFPHPHRLEVHALLSDTALRLRTTLTATAGEAVPVAFGYHPYLRLPGVPRSEWLVRMPVRRRLLLDERMLPTGASEPVEPLEGPLGERVLDDGFAELEPSPEFVLAGRGLRLSVAFEQGYPFAQVYAPDGQDLIAMEPMTAPANALESGDGLSHARPGEPYAAAFSIRVEAGD